jgi:hypothetical protein
MAWKWREGKRAGRVPAFPRGAKPEGPNLGGSLLVLNRMVLGSLRSHLTMRAAPDRSLVSLPLEGRD